MHLIQCNFILCREYANFCSKFTNEYTLKRIYFNPWSMCFIFFCVCENRFMCPMYIMCKWSLHLANWYEPFPQHINYRYLIPVLKFPSDREGFRWKENIMVEGGYWVGAWVVCPWYFIVCCILICLISYHSILLQ